MGAYINSVVTNMESMFTQRQLGITGNQRKKSTEKLSSGYKINRAADDAAGLTISEKMRSQIRGLTQASANVQDGVSLCQVADGYLDEVHDMLHRLTELSVQASNGTLQDEDRASINKEVNALKAEMKRIFKEANFNEIPLFHVPYTPEIKGYPNDMQVFHLGDGGVGGLEFNNVRYNISELQGKGLKIDGNGVATEDFQVEFELWDGETVNVSMNKGQALSSISRNYKWTADENGIYINDKKSADWAEVRDSNGRGITDTGNIAPGEYTFSHHGMVITFEIEETANLDDLFAGINGDAATKPASWDVGVGGAKNPNAADILDSTSYQTIRVTEANKNVIDRTYSVVADENGLAVMSTASDGTSSQTGYVSWQSFKDSSLSSLSDENGNTVVTNGGYPIKNWGDVTDANSSSDITFDGNATYHFTSPDNNVKIEFDFQLAESASLEEVKKALNGAVIAIHDYRSPGTLTGSADTAVGKISAGYSHLLANSFGLQRSHGRDFDNNAATLTAGITVARTTIAGQPSAADRPDVASSGTYSGNTHSVTNRNRTGHVLDDTVKTSADTVTYYYTTEIYSDYELDENGQKIQETDINGNPVTDGNNDPVYKMKDYERKHYYKYVAYTEDEKYTNTYSATDSWAQDVTYTFDGNLNGHDMNDVTRTQIEYYSRSLTQTRTQTDHYSVFRQDGGEVDATSLTDEQKGGAISVSSLPTGYRQSVGEPTYGNYSTTSVGGATLDRVSNTSFNNLNFRDDTGTLFSFNYSQSDISKARNLAASSGPQSVGSINFKATGYAEFDFRPNENIKTISEAQFSSVQLNVPKKNLDIQAGAHEGQVITMEWSPLNLTILGISNADTSTQNSAHNTIDMVQSALDLISETRSTFGAYQNRFESTIRNLDNIVENTQAAESLIRDTDMAMETLKNAKENILMQAGSAMLVHNNQSRQGILSLLQ